MAMLLMFIGSDVCDWKWCIRTGEVWVAGPTVMKGYRKNKAANDEVFHHINGVKYFRTGDLARMVDSKFLKVGLCTSIP